MSLSDRIDARTVGVGAAGGVAAYVFGYLVAYVTQRERIDDELAAFNFVADLFGGDPIPSWQAVGWVFYNAHFVATEVPSLAGGARVENFIASADDGSLTFLYAVPVVLLLAAGFAASSLADAETPVDGASVGALVVAGYLPLAVVGAFAFRYAVGEGTIAPDPVTAVLLAGVVYPAVFGAVGGAVAEAVTGERSPRAAD